MERLLLDPEDTPADHVEPPAPPISDLGEELPPDLKPHPLALMLPAFTAEEFDDLVGDIFAHGQQVAIVTFEGAILDGVHRHRACVKAGKTPRGKPFAGTNPAAFVCSLNAHRRHVAMTLAQKHALIAEVLKENPELSNRQIGRITGTDHKTVATDRAAAERGGEFPTRDTRTDARGREQPAHKPRPSANGGTVTGEPDQPKPREAERQQREANKAEKAALGARQAERAAEHDAARQAIAEILAKLPDATQRLLIKHFERAGFGTTLDDIDELWRALRPELFDAEVAAPGNSA